MTSPRSIGRTSSAFGAFGAFVALSAVAGVLVSAAVTPAVALTGLAASNSISLFDTLPESLAIDQLAQKSNIYATGSDGTPHLLASFYDQNRVEVNGDQMSQFVKDAAVAAEDPRFYEHGGIDLQGTVRALLSNAFTDSVQGGSSITQQYVKNVLVQRAFLTAKSPEEEQAAYDAATEVSEGRKIREMRYAIGLEKQYSKNEILQGYLNIALFGGRVYGIEAAANYYFGTTAADLILPQAASLIAIVNSPDVLRIDEPDDERNGAANGYAANRERRDYVLGVMLDEGKITTAEHAEAVAVPVEPMITQPSTGCATAGGSGYFCDYVTNVLKNNPVFGADPGERWQKFKRGGFDVYTTLDLDLQVASEQAIADNVPFAMEGFDVGSVALSAEPGTGRVLAMAQNKIFSQDPTVLASGPQYSAINFSSSFDYGGSTGFQPGSTYKVFTLIEWLENGHALQEGVDARRRANWGTFRDSCEEGGTVTAPSGWNPKNDEGGSGGNWTALYNTVNSENTGYIAMAKELDLCGIRQTAESLGVHRADGEPLAHGPASVLGTNEVPPLDMVTAFAGIAAQGVLCDPIVIDRIVTADGADAPVPQANCRQAVDPGVTATAAYAMQKVMTSGSGTSSSLNDGVPLIGKTGTSDENEATWMSGASTRVATVVGVFNVTGHVDQRRTWFDSGRAAEARHRIWPRIMEAANSKYPGGEFPEPVEKLMHAAPVPIPEVRGMSVSAATALLEEAGFEPKEGERQDSELAVGLVLGTTPAGAAEHGTIVAVHTSNGPVTPVPNVGGVPKNVVGLPEEYPIRQ